MLIQTIAITAAVLLAFIAGIVVMNAVRNRRNANLSERLIAVIAERNLAVEELRNSRKDCDLYVRILADQNDELTEARAQIVLLRDGVPL